MKFSSGYDVAVFRRSPFAMPRITLFKTPCPEGINSQILQMVVDYLTDISAVGLGPSNLLYNVYQYAVGYEMHLYLEALNGEKGIEVELLVTTAEDDPEQVTGFLLYLPVQGDWEACSVAYMAVREGASSSGYGAGDAGRYGRTLSACGADVQCRQSTVFRASGF
jgi:hypothetical protein